MVGTQPERSGIKRKQRLPAALSDAADLYEPASGDRPPKAIIRKQRKLKAVADYPSSAQTPAARAGVGKKQRAPAENPAASAAAPAKGSPGLGGSRVPKTAAPALGGRKVEQTAAAPAKRKVGRPKGSRAAKAAKAGAVENPLGEIPRRTAGQSTAPKVPLGRGKKPKPSARRGRPPSASASAPGMAKQLATAVPSGRFRGRQAAGGKGAKAAKLQAGLRGRAKAAAEKGGASARQRVESVDWEDETFKVGEDAYVIMDMAAFLASGGFEEEGEPCELCGSDEQNDDNPLLECDRCLRAFHISCLDPPLGAVPAGEWMCPTCAAGGALPPPRARACTLRERFLGREAGLELMRIKALWRRDSCGDFLCGGQWYDTPETTHCGRQAMHGAREVFLTRGVDELEGARLLRPARVLPEDDFMAASGGADSDDTYLCRYEYHKVHQRFCRLSDDNSDREGGDTCWDQDYRGAAGGNGVKAAKLQAGLRGRAKAAARKGGAGARQRIESIDWDDETFKVGEDAYVIMDMAAFVASGGFEEEGEPCELCGSDEQNDDNPLLECDRCLRAFHISCLDPPLGAVPAGEWMCPTCAAGGALPPPRARACTLRERFLGREAGLELMRIKALWRRDSCGDFLCGGQWYDTPETTHCGRQAMHGAREVFLTRGVDEVEGARLLRPARVLPEDEFRAASGGPDSDDTYLCRYEYQKAYQRFWRLSDDNSDRENDDIGGDHDYRVEPVSEESESDDDLEGEGDDDERGGRNVKLRAKRRKLASSGGAKAHRPGAINRKMGRLAQGGIDWALDKRDYQALGAEEIPAGPRQQDASAGGRARAALALTAAPRQLPCRDAERKQIARFLHQALSPGKDDQSIGKCLYISGVPGTGKTVTVMELMRGARRRAEAGKLPPFQFVEINGLRLPSPFHAYSHLYEAMSGIHTSPANAEQLLDDMFGGGGGGGGGRRSGAAFTVLLVDEMDLLLTRNQRVLYNLMEWPMRKGSRLAVIGIANTMDLPERFLPRIASRLGGNRVVFQPYTRQQLSQIVCVRLEGLDVFEPNAILFAAAKVANVSGDVRRSLELCRRAAELAEVEHRRATAGGTPPAGELRVKVAHVAEAVEETFESLHMQMVAAAPRLEKLLLAALLLETRATGLQEAAMEPVVERVLAMCHSHGEPKPQVAQCIAAAASLGAKRVILADAAARRLHMRLALNVPNDDVQQVLQSRDGVAWMAGLNLA